MTDDPFRQASFLIGVAGRGRFPPDLGREVAFAGRSNAGKSSALNALLGRRALARTSKTPGRTQQINFFALGDERRVVDLPGYGYAKVPEEVQRQWRGLIERYLGGRRSLRALVVIVDCRRELTELDLRLLARCRDAGLPCHVLLSKADKLGRSAAAAALRRVRERLRGEFPEAEEDAATVQLFSATAKTGLEEARDRLARWLEEEKK